LLDVSEIRPATVRIRSDTTATVVAITASRNNRFFALEDIICAPLALAERLHPTTAQREKPPYSTA
jgi:hypothetical protein